MPIRPRPNLEECIRARVLAGFSVLQAAERLGKHPSTLYGLEHGRGGASPALLKAMAELYGVPMETLVIFAEKDTAA